MFKFTANRFAVIMISIIHTLFHILTVYGLITFSLHWLWLSFIGVILLRHIGTEIGNHRYFCHRSFEAKPWAEWLMMIGYAFSYGGSNIAYAIGHRWHHATSDTEKDPISPHNIKNVKDVFRIITQTLGELQQEERKDWNIFRKSENKFCKKLFKNKVARFNHEYYWLIGLSPIVILSIIDIRLLIFFIALPCVITFWSGMLAHFLGHVMLFGCYRNYETTVDDLSVNNPWLNIITGGLGTFHTNPHAHPERYNYKMSNRWYETDFPNVFLIEKFLKHDR